jgi:hypothetical protein
MRVNRILSDASARERVGIFYLPSHWTPAAVQNWPTLLPDQPIWQSGSVESVHMLLSVHGVVQAANIVP